MIFSSIKQLDLDNINELFEDTTYFNENACKDYDILKGKIVANTFFETSTRTQTGFHKAILKLGGEVIPITTQTRCSSYDAESYSDALKVISYNSDGVVFRSRKCLFDLDINQIITNGNFINAGDGKNEHPLQALGDCWLLSKRFNSFDFRFGFIGDCTARVFRSMFLLLNKLGIHEFNFYTTNRCEMPEDIMNYSKNIKIIYHDSLDSFLRSVDVIEVIPYKIPFDAPIQKNNQGDIPITEDLIRKYNENITILHPGPRNFELSKSTDSLKNALFFEQARTAVYMKMAVLRYVFSR